MFMEASRFEFYLENGSRIITDACLTGLGDEAGFFRVRGASNDHVIALRDQQ